MARSRAPARLASVLAGMALLPADTISHVGRVGDVGRAPAATTLTTTATHHAWSGSVGVDAVVTALALAA